jgi:hypothetical protein
MPLFGNDYHEQGINLTCSRLIADIIRPDRMNEIAKYMSEVNDALRPVAEKLREIILGVNAKLVEFSMYDSF